MAQGRVSFEVQTWADQRWTTTDLRETEAMAMSLARTLLSNPRLAGVRVVKAWQRADGRSDETVLFSETREAVSIADITVVPITDAHLCSDLYDYFGLNSRMTINRLFRKYIDVAFLTPTELLHHYKALLKIQSFGTLFSAGVDRVASLQGNLPGQTYTSRRDALYAVADKIVRRARTVADNPKLPILAGSDLGAVLDAAVGVAPPGREGYFALVVLCNELVRDRNWLAKLDRLAGIVRQSPREDVLALVDGVLADLVGAPAAFQDIMGYQRNLAQTLCALVDLCEGCFDADKSDAREQLSLFEPLIAAGRMPETHQALVDRLLRQLSGTQPLDRHDPSRERAAYHAVAARLQRPDGCFGGAAVAAALQQRALRLFGPGGAPAIPVEEQPVPSDAGRMAALMTHGARTQDFPPGSLIFREGEVGDRAFMVLSGSVEISTMHKGKRIMLARLGEGLLFGELALFNALPRNASAVTVDGCRLRIIDKTEMQSRVESLDPFCRHWVSYLIERITDLSGRVAGGGRIQ
jgi:hypothetical protein